MSYLVRTIVHLNNVVKALIRPMLSIRQPDLHQYYSINFDEYFIMEYLISCHDPAAV